MADWCDSQNSSCSSSQVVSASVTVPVGHVVVADKWRGTQLVHAMMETVQVLFCSELGVVDFMTSEDSAVMFVSEADLLAGGSLKRRIARFRHHNKSGLRGLVLCHSTTLTLHQFAALQTWASVDLELTTLSVSSLGEAGRFICQLAASREKLRSNPFRYKVSPPPPHTALLATAALLPGLGPKRAQQVLSELGSLGAVAQASPQQLGGAVGSAAAAQTLHKFLHQDNRFTST